MPRQSKNRQSRDNSQIFKQAKRRFHYEPKQPMHPYFLHAKAKKQDGGHGFKQDYSSVKDMRNENNEINESSWIAKLVNGIQQQFSEEHFPKRQADAVIIEGNNYFSEPVDPENIVITTAKNFKHLPVTVNTSLLNSSNPTKKNSINYYKRSEEKKGVRNTGKVLNRAGSSDTIAIKDTSHSKSKKQVKPKMSLNSKKSPRMKSKSEASMKTGLRAKLKSVENAKYKKQQQGKGQESFNGGHTKCATDKTVEQPSKSSKSIPKSNFIKKPSPFNEQPKQNQGFADKKVREDNYDSINQKIDIILSNDKADSLFENKTRLQSNTKQQARVTMRPMNYGSIKKNQISKTQQNAPMSKRSFGSIGSESYKQDSIPTFSNKNAFVAQRAINERPIEENELVTPRQQQALIDKYLRSDYSFKSHKLNDGREMIKSPYKRDARRYAYKIEGIAEEVNGLEEIPTLREKTYFVQNREGSERMTSTFGQENQKDVFQDQLSGKRPSKYENISLRSEIEKQRRVEYGNKQNISTLSTRKNSINPINTAYPKVSPQTIREREQRLCHLNRQVYMHESDKTSALQSLLSSNKQQKLTPKSVMKQQGDVVPSKYSYLRANSTLQQSVMMSKQKQEGRQHSPISEVSINRLTSKLNSYITQHQLQREQVASGEVSNRMLQLNFRELKKHNDFNRSAERNDLFLF